MTGIDPGQRRRLGRTDVEVSVLGLGCAPLGNLFHAVDETTAAATIAAARRRGVRLFDTAPLYGSGLSETRLGASRGPDDVIATKVGRVLDPRLRPDPIFVDVPAAGPRFDFSPEGVRRSLEESASRLGGPIDVCWVHDPDEHVAQARAEALPELRRLRATGDTGAVGVGMNQVEVPATLAEAGEVDAVLVAGRWNLLDQSALDHLLPACAATGTGLVVGGVFASGVLADPDASDATYGYERADSAVVERARAIRERCERHGVTLSDAATNFPLLHPAVTTVLVGARRPGEIEAAADALERGVPDALWADLAARGLLPASVAELVR